MDQANLFETPATAGLLRAEYALAAARAGALLVSQRRNVRGPRAAALFASPDLIGYIPGAVAYRRSRNGRIPRVYYVLYNTAHSFLTGAVVAALWAKYVRREWALVIIAA